MLPLHHPRPVDSTLPVARRDFGDVPLLGCSAYMGSLIKKRRKRMRKKKHKKLLKKTRWQRRQQGR